MKKLSVALILIAAGCFYTSCSKNNDLQNPDPTTLDSATVIVKTLAGDDSNSFVTLRYGRKDYGFGVINSKGIMNWQTAVHGFPLGMGRFKNNAVFFYTPDNPEKLGSINEVHAVMIGIKEKKILADKLVYTNPDKNVIEPVVLNDPAGNFNYLLIRTSDQRGGLASLAVKAENKTHEFTQLSIISLESNLETHIKDLKDIALETFFAGACAGNNNEVYVSSFSKDQLITEKFDENGNLKGKLAVDASIRYKSIMNPVICDTFCGSIRKCYTHSNYLMKTNKPF